MQMNCETIAFWATAAAASCFLDDALSSWTDAFCPTFFFLIVLSFGTKNKKYKYKNTEKYLKEKESEQFPEKYIDDDDDDEGIKWIMSDVAPLCVFCS